MQVLPNMSTNITRAQVLRTGQGYNRSSNFWSGIEDFWLYLLENLATWEFVWDESCPRSRKNTQEGVNGK